MVNYTLLAHSRLGDRALLSHEQDPAHAYWYNFGLGLNDITTYKLAGDPANEYTGPDWVTQFPDTDIPADGAFPEFDTIEQVRHYIDTHERVTAE